MPSGLTSALIIGFGMMQAWSMTAAPELPVLGPFRLTPSQDGLSMEALKE